MNKIIKQKAAKIKISLKLHCLLYFQEIFLSIEGADKEQSKLFIELSDINKGEKPIKRKS